MKIDNGVNEQFLDSGTILVPSKTETGYRYDHVEPRSRMVIGQYDGPTGQLDQVMDFAFDFLTQPHPEVGRNGPVCPFMAKSLSDRLFSLTTTESDGTDLAAAAELILRCKEIFLNMPPDNFPDGLHKAMVIIFPNVSTENASNVIDVLQRELKPEFVREGLMLGQFHPMSDEPGIHNPDFRPLRSPVPLLAIRNMVKGDRIFLQSDENYMAEYKARFG